MRFPSPLHHGSLLKRYKRFLCDVSLDDGQILTAHCPNPGAMTGLQDPGAAVCLSVSDNPKRKLPYGLELVTAEGGWVGINAAFANRIVEEALQEKKIPECASYDHIRPEVRYGQKSCVDFLLESSDSQQPACYLEVKNVHLKRQQGLAEFPDSVTARGARHLEDLAAMVQAGHRAILFYLVQRMDCERFSIAKDIDPHYASTFEHALKHGVETMCYDCDVSPEGIRLRRRLEIL